MIPLHFTFFADLSWRGGVQISSPVDRDIARLTDTALENSRCIVTGATA